MDIDMRDQSQVESEESLRRKRILVYKSILNYYRGRSISLDVILSSKQLSMTIPPDLKTHDELVKNIQGLHEDISLIQSIKNCLKLISYSLKCTEIMSSNNFHIRRDNINKIEGIIYFSKSIMKLYKECCSELDLIEKKKMYSAALAEYGKSLDALRENQRGLDGEDAMKMEKAELQVYKINLTRAMKSILIGFISVNHPNLLQQVVQFKNPVRRNLTVDDFNNTWDVGLSS